MIIERALTPLSPNWKRVVQLDQECMAWPWTPAQWGQLVPGQDLVFLDEEAGKVIGFALYRLSAPEELAHLLKLVLHPDWRGEGRAQQFCHEQFKILCDEKYRRVFLEVSSQNSAALRLYDKLGFRKLRRIEKFYQNGEAAWTMEKPLESSI